MKRSLCCRDRSRLLALGGLLSLVPLPALAAPDATGWRLFGSNELTVEHYEVDGEAAASPYRFEGTFWTERLRLGWRFDNGAGRTARAEIAGRWADNDYLTPDGGQLETLRLELEDGGVTVPYRLGAGDLFADLSRRTLQRQIKGASVEIQPVSSQVDQSLLVVSGTGAVAWEDALEDAGRDLYYSGVSYLVAAPSERHSVVATWVDVTDERAVGADGLGDASHQLGSLFAEVSLGTARLEGEYARLEPESGRVEGSDRTYYAQLSQAVGTVSYRLRYEDNGRGYQTPGSVGLLRDHRIAEAHLRWIPKGRGELKLRVQGIESEVESAIPTLETDVYGASFSGPLSSRRPGLRLLLEADRHDLGAADSSRDQEFTSARFELKDRRPAGLEWSLGSKLRRLEDRLDPALDQETREHSVKLGYRWTLGSATAPRRLYTAIGAVYREQLQSGAYESWSPTFDLTWASGHQRLGLHASFLDQDFAVMTTGDLQYSTQRLTYGWEAGRHRVALDVGRERREPDGGRETDSLRGAFTYRVSFGEAP